MTFYHTFTDGAALVMGGRYTQLEDGLYITSVEPEDSGIYVCEARNMAGSVESNGSLSIQGESTVNKSCIYCYFA